MKRSPSRMGILGRVAMGAALVSGVTLYACNDDDTNVPVDMAKAPEDMSVQVPHNFAQINDYILEQSCAAFTACHSKAGQALSGKLNLCAAPDPIGTSPSLCDPSSTLAGALAAIYQKPSENAQAKAEGLLLVKPCDPDHSFFVKKLELPVTQVDEKVGYGAHMPHGATTAFPPEQLQAIRDWISRGAHLDEPENVTGTTCTLTSDGGTSGDGGT